MGTKRTATGAKTVLAIAPVGVSLFSKVANQSFTACTRMTTMSGERPAGHDARGYLPARLDGDKPRTRELYDCLSESRFHSDNPHAPSVAEAAGQTMRPVIPDIKAPPLPIRRERPAPALQIELELPLGAPDARLPARPSPGSDPVFDRGFAVIDFYI